MIDGAIHINDALAVQAHADAFTAYTTLAGEAQTANLSGTNLGGLILTPGVYRFNSTAQLTGTLFLDTRNDPNGTFIFQIGSSLATAPNSATFSTAINGVGSFTKSGVGALFLTATNTYSGGTTISGGALLIGNEGASGSIVGDVVDNGTLAFNRNDSVTFGGVISGTGVLEQIGPGTLVLTGANS